MLELGRFRVNETHRVTVTAPKCVVRVELTDPRDGKAIAVEGARVCLVGPGANGLVGLVSARAHQDEVNLTTPFDDLVIRSTSRSVEVRSAQPSAISPEEFTRLAAVVGAALGASYEVET